MDDPKPQEQSQQPEPDNGGQPPLARDGPKGKRPTKLAKGHLKSQTPEVGNDAEAEPESRWQLLNRFLQLVKRHAAEIMAICAILALLGPIVALVVKGFFFSPAGSDKVVTTAGPLSVIPQVKRTGVETWGALIEMPDNGGKIVYGIRLENTASQPITGVVARATLPTLFTLVAGKCRYGINQVPLTPCSGSLVAEDGVQLPDLQPGDWIHLVFVAEVSEDVPGNRYIAALRVASDQTGEIDKSAEVKVPATIAEEAVRGLFSQTEGEVEFWNGKPEMAPRSKRLLIAQWQELALEHAHSFAQVPGGQSVGLADLFYEHTYEGQVVELQTRISGRPWTLSRKGRVVKQSYEVEVAGESPRLRCYTWREASHLLKEGDEVDIKAIPIAWSPPGSGDELTMGVCPAARVVQSGDRQGSGH